MPQIRKSAKFAKPFARKIFTAGLVLMAAVASQTLVANANNQNLSSDNEKLSLISGISKSEVNLAGSAGPSALSLGRFYALSHQSIDDLSQDLFLSRLGLSNSKKELTALQLKTLTNSLLFKNQGSNALIAGDALWSNKKQTPPSGFSGEQHVCKKAVWGPQINAWLKINSHGMVSDYEVAKDGFTEKSNRLIDEVLATSVYANLKWTTPFLVSGTESDNFFTEPNWSEFFPPSKMPTMHCHGIFEFASDEQIKAIKLPCRQSNSPAQFDVVIAIPTKGPGTIHDLRNSLSNWDNPKWQKWLRTFQPAKLDLALPKMHLKNGWQDNSEYLKWQHKLLRIIPPPGLCSIKSIATRRNVILDEQGFRFAEANEYYLSRSRLIHVALETPSHSYDAHNNPPNVTYFDYHQKPAMTIDQPFLIMLFDKKTNALLYMFGGGTK